MHAYCSVHAYIRICLHATCNMPHAHAHAPHTHTSAITQTHTRVHARRPAIRQKYVVQSGDNLWKIARAHEIEFRSLLHENDLGNADALKVGDVLMLPVDVTSKNPPPPKAEKKADSLVASTKGAAEKESAEGSTDKGEWELYTIQSGDNPWKIAKTKGLDHQVIVKLNPGLDFTKLSVGQEIKIPKK